MAGSEESVGIGSPLDKGFLPAERRLLEASIGGHKGFLVLRLMLAAILGFEAAQAAWSADRSPWIAAIPAAYAAAVVGLFLAARRRRKPAPAPGPGTFLLDVGASLAVLGLAEGTGVHVYTALLLFILGASLLRKPLLVFATSLAVTVVYALLAFPSSEDVAHVFPLHLSLFLLIALFGVHIASYAATIEQQTARHYEERLAWMQRLSMVGNAMAAVLHEAKTPLGTVVLNAESAQALLLKGKKPSAELKVIAQEADHAAAILQNFLEFVKPSRLELAPLRLDEPLEQALEMLKIRMDERGVAVDARVRPDCEVLGSPRHLLQAFTNILNNAIDAMPSGGKLMVGMEIRRKDVVVSFADTGQGMSRERLERLFEPFATSKADEEGHGLGLSIVRWIAQEHGGEIKVASPGPGRGSQVSLILPLADKS
jgi:signal transduction histidine kinase